MSGPVRWLNTKEASERLGLNLRSLYRFIDEGHLVAYRFGRVIRIQEADVDRFIDDRRIRPGTLEHLYAEPKGAESKGAEPKGRRRRARSMNGSVNGVVRADGAPPATSAGVVPPMP